MDYIEPKTIVKNLISMGEYKAKLKASSLLTKGFLSGAILGMATVLAFTVAVETGIYSLGALAFPVGFVMIILLSYELVTGSFAAVPMALFDSKIGPSALLRSWSLGFLGNLMGSVFFGVLYYIYATKLGSTFDDPAVKKVIAVSMAKTLTYKHLGFGGFLVVTIKAILCNWMVTMGVVMGASSSSTFGKIMAMWLPIFMFFALGLEHSVVNMFVIPTGIMLGAEVSVSDWWIWNQIPVTLGNIIGAMGLTAIPLYYTNK